MPAKPLPLPHILLAVAVMAVWGTNFAIIKIALAHMPPLLFATLRFAFVVFPAIFFVKRPPVPWRLLAAYGVLIGAGQFGLLYIAMKHDISPGLASLVIQTQVFFTIGLAIWLAGERIRPFQLAALGLAVIGVAIIMAHAGLEVTPLGLVLTLLAALCWSAGNLVARISGPVNMLAYVVWASLFSVPPLLVMSLFVEGPSAFAGLRDAGAVAWLALFYQSAGNSLFGYASWGWLLARYPAATVTPFALLVPVFGMATAAFLLGEPLPLWKIAAAGLVLGGLAINLIWPRLRAASALRADRARPL